MNIPENIRLIREKISEIANGCGRKPEDILLVAVTKTISADLIQMAIDSGIQDIGENRVQEAKMKFGEVNRKVNWHLIGHLQTNKVKHAVEMFDLIQSVDRMEVAQEIQKRAGAINKKQRILVQVNTSAEESKSGCRPEDTENLAKSISQLPSIQIEGLMTIGPLTDNKDKIRESFQLLKGLFNKISSLKIPNVIMKDISMGMSQDYPMAIEEGATIIRVGTAIFGERK